QLSGVTTVLQAVSDHHGVVAGVPVTVRIDRNARGERVGVHSNLEREAHAAEEGNERVAAYHAGDAVEGEDKYALLRDVQGGLRGHQPGQRGLADGDRGRADAARVVEVACI